MGYSGHNSTPPRSALVILGGILASIGLWTGVFISTPSLHDALTMTDEPVEMTWEELVDDGLNGNTHVRLVDVQLWDRHASEEDEPIDALVDEDVFAGVDADDLAMADPMAASQLHDAGNRDGEPDNQMVLVLPAGIDADSHDETTAARVVVPATLPSLRQAFTEVDESGTLTGRFTKVNVAGQGDQADSIRYEFSPVHGVLSKKDATTWFVLSFAGVAVGLVICGAGGPSLFCCVFWQGPSLLSVLGYPLRYGRGNNTFRAIYALVGLGGIGYGYEMMFVQGGFGTVGGETFLCSMGFLQMAIGSAALIGASTNMVVDRLNVSMNPTAKKKVNRPKLTYDQVCGMEPSDSISSVTYADRSTRRSHQAGLSPSLRSAQTRLEALGFTEARSVERTCAGQTYAAVVQLGCQEMVVADTEDRPMLHDEPVTRLISVLQDGLAVITLSPGATSGGSKRLGTAGIYSVAASPELGTMLSGHLEETINMAEKRGTAVVPIEAAELDQVVGLADRIFAHIQNQYGEAHYVISSQSYGRFQFPPCEVPVLAAV